MIIEGKAKIKVSTGKISKKLLVFYNPVMKLNRDVSILLLKSIDQSFRAGLPLAGSGVRGIRFLQELENIESVEFNDLKQNFKSIIKENLALNKLKTSKKAKIQNKDANIFLLESKGFDYIDIDPFGTPNDFLDSAVKRISRGGLIAVTATDTSALCGSFKNACRRKYWAEQENNELMHETGLRILIRKAQLIGAQYAKALTPIFSYSKHHYMRVFFKSEKSKKQANKVLKQHSFVDNLGPMWTGLLWDKKLVTKMKKNCCKDEKELYELIKVINQESKIDQVGFYNIHVLAKKNKLKQIPKMEELIKKIKSKKYKVSRTHFNNVSIRSNVSEKELINIIKN